MASSKSSIIKNLAARLEAHGVNADARKIAAVFLETARERDWSREPAEVVAWLEQLAIEVAQMSPANIRR